VLALLEYGRPRELDLKPVRVAEVIDNIRMLFGSTLRGHAARLHTKGPGDLMVTGDSQRLQQVFINLVRNALDAGGNGVEIRINATYGTQPHQPLPDGAHVLGDPDCRVSEGRRFAEITVEDDGPGIDPEVLPHIFDPFFTTREPGRGMGLGLYVIQEIIKEHAGCIAVTSTPGTGTRFILRLPGADSDA
jgi:two-component system NtrC family sensor kinase